jgi:hypothetical protein
MSTCRLCLLGLLLSGVAGAQPYRLNCGGGSETDVYGRAWSADVEYTPASGHGAVGGVPSTPASAAVGGTRDTDLHRTIRVGASEYRFDVPDGTYTVELRFAERERHGPGLRVQTVEAEGLPLLIDLDLGALIGRDYAFEPAFRVDVADGQLNVRLAASVGATLLSAISVVATPPDGTGPVPPGGVAAHHLFRGTVVYWNRGSEVDLAGYQVHGAPAPGGPWSLLSEPVVFLRRWVDDTLLPGATRYYRVCGVDVFGNVGAPGSTLSATAEPESATPLVVYDLYIDPAALYTLDQDPYGDAYVPAAFYAGALGEPHARARYRGYLGRRYSKKSFNVRFDGRPFEGRDKVVLKSEFGDTTLLREAVAYHVLAGCGVPTPWTRYAHLHLNTAHRGVFLEIEGVSRAFFDRHRLDEQADLYKAEGGRCYPLADPVQYELSYEKETNRPEPYDGLIDLIEGVAAAPAATLDQAIAARVDVQRLLDYYAAIMLVADRDFTWRNYYLYRNRQSGLFWPIVWDKDATLYTPSMPLDTGSETAGSGYGQPNGLLTRVLEVPLFRTLYVEKLQAHLTDGFDPPATKAATQALYAEMVLDGEADLYKRGWEANGSLHGGPNSIESFIDARVSFVTAEIPGFVTPVVRDLLLNEVQARNRTTLADAAGDFDDWIELVNVSASALDAGGYFLTDDATDRTRWMIPFGTVVPAGGALLVWADAEPGEGPLHATFQLDGDGEGLTLYAPLTQGNGLVDLVGLEPQLPDHSFGRPTDGAPRWRDLATPTPGAANTPAGDLPPVVWGTSLDPPVPVAGVPVTVRTMVLDDQDDVSRLELSHDLGGGWVTVSMLDDGQPPDACAGDGEFVVTVPGAPHRSIVEYHFTVEDGSGHVITEPLEAPTEFLCYGIPALAGGVRINEICADNESGLADGAGDFDDWIELVNLTGGPLDVSGLFLTDDLRDSTRWALPVGTVIPPHGYLLVWADGEPLEGPLHATFRLASTGESVGLFDSWAAGNGLLDAVTFGRQLDDTSTGRLPDGGSAIVTFAPPTPGATNGPPPPTCPVTICGDCDQDGDIDVLDSLAASQHAVGLVQLTGAALASCDVDVGSSPVPVAVTIVDALTIARVASGLVAALDCCP